MLAQYVYSAKVGLFRIVRHGRRWRSLLDEHEVDRHDSAEHALAALRRNWPHARLPDCLTDWRFVPELALAHSRVSREPTMRWQVAG
ncbi:hypothetical protein EYV96_14820 [Dyella terrae]|uniref:Uncharacterized protein n=2 Tax=Dyella TaxID=231454 RepID=A0A4R0YRU7_9GAMM|nr:hypothetical protein EYV96_14820 [Dyella terrae]TCI07757.1 hypothetical protein EZM97_24050 [Dyella soli]